MSVWKSPLLYIGVLLILIAGAALAVPPFINWTQYRADIEDYGKRLTGRDVTVAGDVSVRLFPWPRLWLDDVRIANPPGAKFPELVRTGKVKIGLALAPMVSGDFVVETVEIDKPVFAFERLASGRGTWSVEPLLRLDDLIDVSKITVAGIKITGGTVILADGRRGGAAKLEDVDATLSAPGLDGPWRLRGVASYGDARTSIAIATGKFRANEVLRYSVHLSPEEDAGLSYSFDGEIDNDKVSRGRLKVRPAKSSDGRSDAELDLRPLAFNADVTASFDSIELLNIEIAPDDKADAGNLVTGSAVIELGSRIRLKTQLKAAKLDLDQMTGTRAREALYNGDVFSTLSAIMAQLPKEIEAQFGVNITSLVLGGESLDGFHLTGDVRHDRMNISQLEASMPGQTTGKLSGVFVADPVTPQFGGDFSIESVSLRDVVTRAASAENSASIETVWSGARGKLSLNGTYDLTGGRLRLIAQRFTFDDAQGSGSLALAGGAQPELSVRIVADSINLDRYAPNGLTTRAVQSDTSTGLIDLAGAAMEYGDLQLILQADELQLHGVAAQDIAIDVGANAEGIELRTVEIGKVGDARLDVAGLLKFPGSGVSGALRADVKAADARGLLRLIGVISRDEASEPGWAGSLGAVDLDVRGEAKTDDSATTATLSVVGTAGSTNLELDGRFSGDAAKWQDGDVQVSGSLKASDAAALAAQVGVDLLGGRGSGFSASLNASGALLNGLSSRIETQMLGTQTQFAGKVGVREGGKPFVEGRLAILAERAQELYAAIGLQNDELGPAAQVLSGEGEFGWDDGVLRYENVNGTVAGTAFKGGATVAFATGTKPQAKISGEVGRVDLSWLIGLRLFALDGLPRSTQTTFDLARDIVADAELKIAANHIEVMPNVSLSNGKIAITDNGETIETKVSGILGGGQPAEGSLILERRSHDISARGEAESTVDLGGLLKTSDGAPALTGEAKLQFNVEGSGRSPAGILSTLSGKGNYSLGAARLGGVNIADFSAGLRQLKDAKALDRLVDEKLGSGELAFAGGEGDIVIDAGVMKFASLPIEAAGVKGPLRVIVDLPSGEIDVSSLLEMDAIKGLPAFEVAFAGPPQALQKSYDLAALKSFVGVNVLLKGMDKLEELQREQERIFRQETNFDRKRVLEQLEAAALKRRKEAEEARRKAEAERLQTEIDARKKAEAESKRLAEELEKQREIDAEKRRADEIARQLSEEEARRALEEAASRTRLEKHIRRAQPSDGATAVPAPVPAPVEKPRDTALQPLPEILPIPDAASGTEPAAGQSDEDAPVDIVPSAAPEPSFKSQSATDRR